MPGPTSLLAVVLLAGVLFLGPAAMPAAGQATAPPDAPSSLPDERVFDPDLGQELSDTQPEDPTSDVPIEPGDAETLEEEDEVSSDTIEQAGWGSAADQTTTAKLAEADADCAGTPPPTSTMLGIPGAIAGSNDRSVGWIVLFIAGGALLVAGIAYALRRRRDPSASRGSLENAATIVGILGGIAGLAVQFVPGVGVQQEPAPAATMTVRDVNARIPRVEYTRKINSKLPEPEDRREVGNVIWLEIHLEGYRDKDPVLQYGLYDPAAGNALLPGTAVVVPIPTGDEDVQSHFVPIWVGYPLSEKFRAGFRLLDGSRVQAIAETNDMRASRYRYSCD